MIWMLYRYTSQKVGNMTVEGSIAGNHGESEETNSYNNLFWMWFVSANTLFNCAKMNPNDNCCSRYQCI